MLAEGYAFTCIELFVWTFIVIFMKGTSFIHKIMNLMEKRSMYNNSIVESKERLIGLDIVRVISCFMILTFHTFHSLSLSYGFLDKYVEQGAIFVSVFFILSGFSLYYANYKKNLSQIKEVKLFYKKMFIGILPAYFIAWIGFYIPSNIYNISLHDIIRLFPIDFLGLRCEL